VLHVCLKCQDDELASFSNLSVPTMAPIEKIGEAQLAHIREKNVCLKWQDDELASSSKHSVSTMASIEKPRRCSIFFFAKDLVLLKDIRDYNRHGICSLSPLDQRRAILPYTPEF
jgi:hypothetical protein